MSIFSINDEYLEELQFLHNRFSIMFDKNEAEYRDHELHQIRFNYSWHFELNLHYRVLIEGNYEI